MPSSHLILCRPLFLLPPILPTIRVFFQCLYHIQSSFTLVVVFRILFLILETVCFIRSAAGETAVSHLRIILLDLDAQTCPAFFTLGPFGSLAAFFVGLLVLLLQFLLAGIGVDFRLPFRFQLLGLGVLFRQLF